MFSTYEGHRRILLDTQSNATCLRRYIFGLLLCWSTASYKATHPCILASSSGVDRDLYCAGNGVTQELVSQLVTDSKRQLSVLKLIKKIGGGYRMIYAN